MKTVIEMARKSKLDIYGLGCPHDKFIECVEAFAELVRADAIAAEREACAKVCDVLAVHPEYASEVTKLAAMAIRARSNT
ncbi:hypothetical protein [Limnohabitans sp.]|uniref:hypothetical protein n=1 Tax=Limnohabitans sp. TaxID=1907725 RepID=UPI00334033C7